MALKALKKQAGGKRRKWPVTVSMLKWIRRETAATMSRSDFTVFWATINLGWFFLLRAGEYLKHDGMDWDHNKVLVGANIDLVLEDGTTALLSQVPAGVSVRIIGSKTDVYNVGQIRKHFRSGDLEGVCPVAALTSLRREFPHRFGSGAESHLPVCRWTNGQPVLRTQVSSWLERAAAAQGVPPTRMGSHSLRIGGATALFNATGSIDQVKRFGRWLSSAFQGYLWESDEHAKGISRAMSQHQAKLWAEHGLGAEAAAQHYGDRPSSSPVLPPQARHNLKVRWGGTQFLPSRDELGLT